MVLGGVVHQIAFHVTAVPGRGRARTIRAPSWCRRFTSRESTRAVLSPRRDNAPHEPKGPFPDPIQELPFFLRIDHPPCSQEFTGDKSGPEGLPPPARTPPPSCPTSSGTPDDANGPSTGLNSPFRMEGEKAGRLPAFDMPAHGKQGSDSIDDHAAHGCEPGHRGSETARTTDQRTGPMNDATSSAWSTDREVLLHERSEVRSVRVASPAVRNRAHGSGPKS